MADSLDRARDELPDDGYHRGNRLGHGVLSSLPPHPSSLYLRCFRSFNRDQSLDTIMSHIPGNMRETCFVSSFPVRYIPTRMECNNKGAWMKSSRPRNL